MGGNLELEIRIFFEKRLQISTISISVMHNFEQQVRVRKQNHFKIVGTSL